MIIAPIESMKNADHIRVFFQKNCRTDHAFLSVFRAQLINWNLLL